MRTSPSGKSYVGQTKFIESIRWEQHCQAAFNQNSKEYNLPLSNAIRKYGKNNFQVKILEDNISTDQINNKERYYIELYETYKPQKGYNCNLGFKNQLSVNKINEIALEWEKGFSVKEISNILNLNTKTIDKYLETLGITKEQKLQRRNEAVSKTNKYQRDILFKEIEKLWNQGFSVSQICDSLKKERHYIVRILKENNITQKEILERSAKIKNGIAILQYDLENNFIKEYRSSSEALRELKSTNRRDLKRALEGELISYKNYKWKYKN